ncbi:MAG TPA: mannitol dehydrogenase family protein [Cellulomonas sp.]
MPSLSRSTLPAVAAAMRPRALPWELRPRTVHLGLGAFTRAHQSVYTEGAAAASGSGWGIAAVEPRVPAVADALRAQDGLFSVTELAPDGPATRVVGSLTEALVLDRDGDRLLALLTDPAVAVVTATITEKGYYRVPGSDHLDVHRPEVAADLARAATTTEPGAGTVVGRLAELLAARSRAQGAPISVVSCDNMAGNGRALGQVVRDFVAHTGWTDRDAVLDWLAGSVTFPQTIVDRIVPATTAGTLAQASAALGLDDAAAVAGEQYRQWVLEDAFAAERPAWEVDGALVVPDIAPFQLMKLRLLNGSHSALAYLGLSCGLGTVAAAMRSAWGERLVRALCAEVAPTLPAAPTDPHAYADTLVARFANPAIAHQLRQIGSDGSLKVVERWLEPLRALRGARRPTPVLELALAGWANATRPADGAGTGQRYGTTDPAAETLAAAWATGGADDAVRLLLRAVGADDLADDDALVQAVAGRVPAVAAGRIEL